MASCMLQVRHELPSDGAGGLLSPQPEASCLAPKTHALGNLRSVDEIRAVHTMVTSNHESFFESTTGLQAWQEQPKEACPSQFQFPQPRILQRPWAFGCRTFQEALLQAQGLSRWYARKDRYVAVPRFAVGVYWIESL